MLLLLLYLRMYIFTCIYIVTVHVLHYGCHIQPVACSKCVFTGSANVGGCPREILYTNSRSVNRSLLYAVYTYIHLQQIQQYCDSTYDVLIQQAVYNRKMQLTWYYIRVSTYIQHVHTSSEYCCFMLMYITYNITFHFFFFLMNHANTSSFFSCLVCLFIYLVYYVYAHVM